MFDECGGGGGAGAPPHALAVAWSRVIEHSSGLRGLQSYGGVLYFRKNIYLLYLSGSLDTHSDAIESTVQRSIIYALNIFTLLTIDRYLKR